ncbi:uncharacterized protein TNCV_4682391 [Trichonephila clavipes]|nr:uncharacterized protein TNCV_4682391 [Trichonephila clavipes]
MKFGVPGFNAINPKEQDSLHGVPGFNAINAKEQDSLHGVPGFNAINPKEQDSLQERRKSTRGLLATDHVILNHSQVTWTTPELAPPLLTTTPHQQEDVSALDRFNVHRCPTRRVFSGTGIELVTKQATIRYLYHSATAAHLALKEMIKEVDEDMDKKISFRECCFTNVRCQMLVRVLTKTLRPLDCKFGTLRDGAILTLFQDGSYNNN